MAKPRSKRPPIPAAVREWFAAQGKVGGEKGGQLGGKARAERLSASRRQEIAKRAAAARWARSRAT